jgi:hypothetical protein
LTHLHQLLLSKDSSRSWPGQSTVKLLLTLPRGPATRIKSPENRWR